MSIMSLFQVSLEIWGCLICIIVAILSGNKAYTEAKALKKTWSMLLINAILLTSDCFSYVFGGDTSTLGELMSYFSNFALFFSEGVLTFFFAMTVQTITKSEGERLFASKYIKFSAVAISIHLIGVIITPITGFYYYFDETNVYHRGIGISLSFMLTGLVAAMGVLQLYKKRDKLSKYLCHAVSLACVFLAICFAAQFLKYGLSLMNIGITTGILTLYFCLWNETKKNEFDLQIAELEKTIGELTHPQEE